MDKLQQWVALTVVAVLAVLAAGWFLLLSPQRAEAADLGRQADTGAATVGTLELQLATLQAQALGLPAQQAEIAAVQARIPAAPQDADLVRALTAAAAASGVELVSVVPGTAAPVPAGTTTTTTAPAATATTAGAAAAPAAAGTLQALPLTLQVVGAYAQLELYLSALEALPRALRVTALSVVPGANPVSGSAASSAASDGSSLAATITAQVYVAAPASTATTTTTTTTTTTAATTPVTNPSTATAN